VESLYLAGLLPLEVFTGLLHPVLGLSRSLPFLPLLLTSLYCAVGVTYCWLKFYWIFLFQDLTAKAGKQD